MRRMFLLVRGLPADSAVAYAASQTRKADKGVAEIPDLPDPEQREPEGPRTRRVPIRSAMHLAETLKRSPALRQGQG